MLKPRKVKGVYPDYIMLYKFGSFFKTFGKDTYILSDLFNYKLDTVGQNTATCGFPINAIYKVRVGIEERSINYMLIDPRNNYGVDVKENFKNLNRYTEQFKKSYNNMKCKKS